MENTDQAAGKKYPGHFPCQFHDIITETMKTVSKTVCKKCFSDISELRVQTIAQLMVENFNIKYQLVQYQDALLECEQKTARLTILVEGLKSREKLLG